MLRQRQPSDSEIANWLSSISQNFNMPFDPIAFNHWRLKMRNSEAEYILDIFDHGEWITYGVVLVHDVEGREKLNFYGKLLDLSARLNGVHIGREGNALVLTREEPKMGFNPMLCGQSITLIDSAHKIAYREVLQQIKRLGLKARK